VDIVRTEVSEESIASINRAEQISEQLATATSFYAVDGGDKFLQNVGYKKRHKLSHLRRQKQKQNKLRGPQSASEIYRLSDRHL
jgi:hypothetical protein